MIIISLFAIQAKFHQPFIYFKINSLFALLAGHYRFIYIFISFLLGNGRTQATSSLYL